MSSLYLTGLLFPLMQTVFASSAISAPTPAVAINIPFPAVFTTTEYLSPPSYSNFSVGTGGLPRSTYYACTGYDSTNSMISLLGGVTSGEESQQMTVIIGEYGDELSFIDHGQDNLSVFLYGYSQICTQLDDQLYVVATMDGDSNPEIVAFELNSTWVTSAGSTVVESSDFDPYNVHTNGTGAGYQYDSVCITATNRDGTYKVKRQSISLFIYFILFIIIRFYKLHDSLPFTSRDDM